MGFAPFGTSGVGGAGLTLQQEVDLTANTAARHGHANKAILDGTTGTFTLARQEKLDGVQDTFKGTFLNAAAIETAWPTPLDGWAVWNTDTATVWSSAGGVWADTLATSVGDMLKATYDPQGVAGDAFNLGNMVDSVNFVKMTADERVKLANSTQLTTAERLLIPTQADCLTH